MPSSLRYSASTIRDLADSPHHTGTLQNWFNSEWESADLLGGRLSDCPGPIIAVDSHDGLLGGLAFTIAKSPLDDTQGLWINALYVNSQARRKGVASALINSAHQKAAEFGAQVIFAFTDVPTLYKRNGWRVISMSTEGSVMTKELSP